MADQGDSATPENVDTWLNSVVMIQTDAAWCSGAVIDKTHIVTAYHCVSSGGKPLIFFRDGQESKGVTISAKPKSDIAIIEADIPDDISALSIRKEPTKPGTRVYAMGHPLAQMADNRLLRGTLRWSVSEGIISAVGESFIQTDAALNPGNSGGPVVDAKGSIVGIVSRKLRAENLGFLGPSKEIPPLLKDPQPLKWWGGQLAIGGWNSTLLDESAQLSVGIFAQYRMRERVITTLGFGTPYATTGDGYYKSSYTSLAIRQGFGSGNSYFSLDLGGAAVILDRPTTYDFRLAPEAYARLGMGAFGLKYGQLWVDEKLIMNIAFDIDLLGVVRVF